MSRMRFVAAATSVGLIVTNAGVALGQDYPTKPIRILTGTVGAGSDVILRRFTPELSAKLGQPVIVDNRAPVVVEELAVRAPPDGYTLVADGASLWVETLMQKKSYDPVRDFAPITVTTVSPNMLVVHPAVATNSVKDLIALAKATPGALNYAAGSVGSSNHLAAELFKSMAGVDIVRIPYKGGGPAIIDVIAGRVQVMFPSTTLGGPHVNAGRLRALAIGTPQRSAQFPALPTAAESGLPGYDSKTTYGIFAPAKTPAAIINRLNREIVQVLNGAEMKQRFLEGGLEIVGNSPQQFAALIKSDLIIMSKVIKDAGIKVD